MRIPWEVTIEFQVRDGLFVRGFGKARWIDALQYPSVPEGWIDCSLVEGTYLDRNLKMRETPWVRYAAFPVGGEVVDGQITVVPAYQPPGNYLAVIFQCATDNPIATNWFVFAERAKNEEGKRQDFELVTEGDTRRARVRQVKTLYPLGSVQMPLRDGWQFTDGTPDARGQVRYLLQRTERD